MNPSRRAFLASLGLAPLVARSYFDMGSWQRQDSGVYVYDLSDDALALAELRLAQYRHFITEYILTPPQDHWTLDGF